MPGGETRAAETAPSCRAAAGLEAGLALHSLDEEADGDEGLLFPVGSRPSSRFTRSRRPAAIALVAGIALVLPGAASAHAYLISTVPTPSVTLSTPPASVRLTYDEAVEPRFAVVSVTDVHGRDEASGPVMRAASNPDTLVVPLKRVGEGWYLVYWRAISLDGHPVQGAFTFAFGPSAGPTPQFAIPHIAGSATTPTLVVMKWLAFLSVMTAIGLFVLRMVIAQPVVRRVSGASLRAVSIAFAVAALLGLAAVPVYLEEATAIDSLRSFWDFRHVVPLIRATAFGRGYADVELCFALFCAAAASAIWLDRPDRRRRSVAELLALTGAFVAASATLLLPGMIGHAGQTSPRGIAVPLDWLHLLSGSIWIGGLVGLLILWGSLPVAKRLAGLRVCVPRFSNAAFVSVIVLLGTGVGASILHLPVLSALWLTSYGQAIVAKSGILLAALALAAVNLLRTRPGLSRTETGEASGRLLRNLVTGETALVAAAILVSAILSSLAPPPPAFAAEGSALARVGPGMVAATVKRDGYTLQVLVTPNRAAGPNSFALRLTRAGRPVRGADVTLRFAMLDMQMPSQEYDLAEASPGIYMRKAPALVMVGHWALAYTITPKAGQEFSALVVDHAGG